MDMEQQARDMGWKPLEEFRGDQSNWVDAETYVKRGQTYLPLLRKENERLARELESTKSQVTELSTTVRAAHEAIETFKEYQTAETKRHVEVARRELIAQLKQARESGDVDAEVQAQREINKLDVVVAETPKPAEPPKGAPPAKPAVDPNYEAWLVDNSWFQTNARKRGLALGIAEELRADPRNAGLKGREFYDKITEELEAMLSERKEGKVAGGRSNGSGPTPTTKRVRTFDDLPAEAKAACDRMADRLVGKGRAFADSAAWRTHYTKEYFVGEDE